MVRKIFLLGILFLFIYSYFSSELNRDFTHEFNNLRPNSRQISNFVNVGKIIQTTNLEFLNSKAKCLNS